MIARSRQGKAALGSILDPYDLLPVIAFVPQTAGEAEDYGGILDPFNCSHDILLSCQHHGSAACMYAGGSCRNLWGNCLSEPEAIAALSGLLRSLHHLCGDVSGIRVAGIRVSGIR